MVEDMYISILKVSSIGKLKILEQIIELTLLLEEVIQKSPFSYDEFNDIVSKKNILVKELEQLDAGFEKVYQHVRAEINDNKNLYKKEIEIIQATIKQIMDKSVKLRVLETKLKQLFDDLSRKQRTEIQQYYINKKISSSYNPYQNHNNIESYFFDKKK